MNVQLSAKALDHLRYWAATKPRTLSKILDLIEYIRRDPYEGTGQPEPLRHELEGYWSRRIDKENRIVYKPDEAQDLITVVSCKGHYDNL
jgi:toxin YoeB